MDEHRFSKDLYCRRKSYIVQTTTLLFNDNYDCSMEYLSFIYWLSLMQLTGRYKCN